MTTVSEEALELEVRIAASPSTVFSFLKDADGIAQWFGSSVEMDPQPGGIIRIDINGRDIAKGEIVEIVAPERIVFTFGWEADGHPVPPGSSTVEITLKADAATAQFCACATAAYQPSRPPATRRAGNTSCRAW